MRVLFLGGGRLGETVLRQLLQHEDDVVVASSVGDCDRALDAGVDWIVSAGWRHILTEGQLGKAGDTCNVHPSLLPWGRGANPNVWALAAGEPAGVTLHRMVPAVDAGPIWAQRQVEVTFEDRAKRHGRK